MLTAIRISDNKKVVGEFIEKSNEESYKCEVCDKSVVHHRPNDRVRIGHFKHSSNESPCPNNNNRESIEHLKSKIEIYERIKNKWRKQLKSIEIEKCLFNKETRADIYIETKKNKIAIEVQASLLTVDEIKRRTIKYFENNVYVLWILLYDYERFYEFRNEYGHKETGSWGIINSGYFKRDRIKLKEFEIFLYHAYYKNLIFWDLDQERNKDFIVMKLEDYWNNAVEFKQDGTEYSYDAKKTKTIKSILSTQREVSFDKFKIVKGRLFPLKEYEIPERTIFYYDNKVNID